MRRPATSPDNATQQRIPAFQRLLLRWYGLHQRPLPWRKTKNPYKILVSEIMLQQTQVDRVIPKYHEFLRRYPTVAALAKARVQELKKVWYPLGYNIRPLRLRSIARQVVSRHAGKIPDSYDGLVAMDGIGRYTAGAVLSFAFDQDAAILDTNVARLLQRYFGVPHKAAKSKATPKPTQKTDAGNAVRYSATRPAGATRRVLWELAAQVIPPGNAYDINQAMMDFGALVCTARTPKCSFCALRRHCHSYPFRSDPAPQTTEARDLSPV